MGQENKTISKKTMLDETKRMLMEEDVATQMDDSDDDRLEFADAEEEEVTDQVIREFKRKKRPLKVEEVEKISRRALDNMKDSILSNVLTPDDYLQVQQSQYDQTSYAGSRMH